MNGQGTTGTAARATWTPRKQIARRGLIRPLYFVFEMTQSFCGDYAQSSWNLTTARGRRETGYETKLGRFFLLSPMFDCVALVIELLTRELGLCLSAIEIMMEADATGVRACAGLNHAV